MIGQPRVRAATLANINGFGFAGVIRLVTAGNTAKENLIMRCRPVLVCALVLLGSLATLAQDHVPDKAALSARAQELLRQSRMALGGEDALGKVQSLSASGKLRQFMKYAVVTSPTEVRDR